MIEPAVAAQNELQLAGLLQSRLVEFVRLARSNNFRVGVAEELDAQKVALSCGIAASARLRWGLRALLCSSQDDWQRFDELYDAYWHPANVQSRVSTAANGRTRKRPEPHNPTESARQEALRNSDADSQCADDSDDTSDGGGTREGASFAATLAKTDFQALADPDEM
ncbi:MAG: hypothetical protein OEV47_20320, partial [Gammaproteobacteria bacterium]|nr:hypothetical protein [Gammaproteobacteria bacterium]